MTTYVLAAATLVPAYVPPPPGIDPAAYRAALLADSFESLDDLANVTAYVAAAPPDTDLAERTGPTLAIAGPHDLAGALRALHAVAGATIGAVVAGDAPDLPGLLVGKLFGACEDRLAGVLPAADGRLAGLATRLPPPPWLDGLTLEQGLDDVHESAPRGAVVVGPGWHRLAEPGDVRHLDPRLEGWDATRSLLEGRHSDGG
jgi:hypothetical protein